MSFYPYLWSDSYAIGSQTSALGFYACKIGFSLSIPEKSIYYSCNTSEAFSSTIGGAVAWSDATIPAGRPNVLRLTLDGEIPTYADHETGRLRMFYTQDSSRVTDEDGHLAPSILPAGDNPGNVEDTVK
jgi:hypothetical protein